MCIYIYWGGGVHKGNWRIKWETKWKLKVHAHVCGLGLRFMLLVVSRERRHRKKLENSIKFGKKGKRLKYLGASAWFFEPHNLSRVGKQVQG